MQKSIQIDAAKFIILAKYGVNITNSFKIVAAIQATILKDTKLNLKVRIIDL